MTELAESQATNLSVWEKDQTHLMALLEAGLHPFRASVGGFAAVAAGNYTDNDVISNDADAGEGDPITFEDALRVAGGASKIIGAKLTYGEDGILATSELFLFNAIPTITEMDDNAAFTGVDAADAPNFLGSILFAAAVDVGGFALSLPSALTPAAPLFIHGPETTIYGVLVLRDGESNETAGMLVEVTLYLE